MIEGEAKREHWLRHNLAIDDHGFFLYRQDSHKAPEPKKSPGWRKRDSSRDHTAWHGKGGAHVRDKCCHGVNPMKLPVKWKLLAGGVENIERRGWDMARKWHQLHKQRIGLGGVAVVLDPPRNPTGDVSQRSTRIW